MDTRTPFLKQAHSSKRHSSGICFFCFILTFAFPLFAQIPGDINQDNSVDPEDLLILHEYWKVAVTPTPTLEPTATIVGNATATPTQTPLALNLEEIGSVEIPTSTDRGQILRGNILFSSTHAFLVDEYGFQGIDIHDPAQMVVQGRYDATEGYFNISDLHGDIIYLINDFGITEIVDISNPDHPAMISSFFFTTFPNSFVHDLVVDGTTAFVVAESPPLTTVDISNPISPKVFEHRFYSGYDPLAVAYGDYSNQAEQRRRLFLLSLEGITVLDVNDPYNPVWQSLIPLGFQTEEASSGGIQTLNSKREDSRTDIVAAIYGEYVAIHSLEDAFDSYKVHRIRNTFNLVCDPRFQAGESSDKVWNLVVMQDLCLNLLSVYSFSHNRIIAISNLPGETPGPGGSAIGINKGIIYLAYGGTLHAYQIISIED